MRTADTLPNGATITDVFVEFDPERSGRIAGRVVVEIEGRYPETTDLLPHLTAPVDGEYWLAYLSSGFVEAYVDVGTRHQDPTALSYTDSSGTHWLRRCSPRLHHEFDDYATMLVTVVHDAGERDAVLSVPSARRLLARHYNYEATMRADNRPDPIVLIEAEPSDRTVWGPARIGSDVGHELAPVLTEARSVPDGWRFGIDDGAIESVHPIDADGQLDWDDIDLWDEDSVEQWMNTVETDDGDGDTEDGDGDTEDGDGDTEDGDGDTDTDTSLADIVERISDVTIPTMFDDSPTDSLDLGTLKALKADTDDPAYTISDTDGSQPTSDDDSTTSTDAETTEHDRRGGRRQHGIGGRRQRRARAAGSADVESDH